MRGLNISRLSKMFLALAVAFLGPGLMAASADNVPLSGMFTNGESFSGTITTAGATITSGSLTVFGGADAGLYTDSYAADFPTYGEYLFQDSKGGSPSTYPYLDLLFSDASTFSEASLCSDANTCGGIISQLRVSDGHFYDLTGAATIPTPEPVSLLLLGSGLVTLGFIFRKQFAATN